METSGISNELNREAWMTCLAAIAKFPQASGGSSLIADKVMKSFYGEGRLTPTVLVHTNPNPKESADRVNEIHRLFGVKRTVTPTEAVSYILSFAIESINSIQRKTLVAADLAGKAVPDILREDAEAVVPEIRSKTNSSNYNFKMIKELEDFLIANKDICDIVRAQIKNEANTVRNNSSKQQEYAKHKPTTQNNKLK